MSFSSLLRLVEVLRRQLDADDARIEIGGRPPRSDKRVLYCALPNGARVVVRFANPVASRDAMTRRLEALVATFSSLVSEHERDVGATIPPARLLALTLDDLRSGADAMGALVFDATSPVVWGRSGAVSPADVDALLAVAAAAARAETAGVDPRSIEEGEASALPSAARELALARAELARARVGENAGVDAPAEPEVRWEQHLRVASVVAAIRERISESDESLGRLWDQRLGYVARSFAGIYWLVLVFEGPFSQLHAEAAMVRALPRVERYVLSLPPVDPPPRRGRVIALKR